MVGLLSRTKYFLRSVFCFLVFYGSFLIAADKKQENSQKDDNKIGLYAVVDAASIGYSSYWIRKAEVLQSDKFSNFFSPASYAGAGLGANYFFAKNFGFDLSLLFGKFWLNFSEDRPCTTYADSHVCETVSNNRANYADINNVLFGTFYRFELSKDSKFYIPKYLRANIGYVYYSIDFNKPLTSAVTGLDVGNIQSHGFFVGIDLDFLYKSWLESHISLPDLYFSIGVGIRYHSVTLPGQTNEAQNWIYSVPIKAGIVF